MNDLYIKAFLAGVFFASWPLFMNRSGLSGNVSSVIMSTAVLIGVIPLALYVNGFSLPTANWVMAIIACILAALGIICFNGMLSGARPENVGTLFTLTTIVQIVIIASYQIKMDGNLSWGKVMGYCAAVMSAYLLLK